MKTTKKEQDFANILITNSEGKKLLPIIISLDEPETHQHPYRQRALIKSIQKIINNKSDEFIELLQDVFGIDGLIGQLFVVTHSPNILLNDYKQMIRLYKTNGKVYVRCGQNIEFGPKTEKHLRRSFMYFKEAMFSKYIILVEGDTEFGALPVFIERMAYDIDEKSIGIIKLDGADSVPRCMELYNAYDIKAIAIIDKDKEETYKGHKDIFFTKEIDFEAEVYRCFEFSDYMKYQKTIGKIGHFIKFLKTKVVDFKPGEFARDPSKCKVSKEVQDEIMSFNERNEVEDLRKIKNAVNGALLARYVSEIPTIFQSTIERVINELDSDD